MTIYCLSGFGAGNRLFRKLELKGYELVYIPFLAPQTNESLTHYAIRLSKEIDTTKPYALMGFSFGGLLAVEIAKHLQTKHVIIISSIVLSKNIRTLFRCVAYCKLYKAIPFRLLQQCSNLDAIFHFVKHRSDYQLFKTILLKNDSQTLKWVVQALLTWKNATNIHCYRIHGELDKVVPLRKKMKINYCIKNGGHFIPLSHPHDVSKAIQIALTASSN